MTLYGFKNRTKHSCCCGNHVDFNLKLFDTCKFKKCVTLGPIISKENHECIVTSMLGNSNCFGRIVLPGGPILAPQEAVSAKILRESFCITSVDVSNIVPSPFEKNCWDVEIIYEFEFKLQLQGAKGIPLKVKACPTTFCEIENPAKTKDYIKARVCCISQVSLYGNEASISQAFYHNTKGCLGRNSHDPFLIRVKACPLEVIFDHCNEFFCSDPCCDYSHNAYYDPYSEPFNSICVVIELIGSIRPNLE